MKDLGIVANVACCCIVFIMFCGSFYDLNFKEQSTLKVPCSINIVNMAKKINVILDDECEVNYE